jgi:hypothetical protein
MLKAVGRMQGSHMWSWWKSVFAPPWKNEGRRSPWSPVDAMGRGWLDRICSQDIRASPQDKDREAWRFHLSTSYEHRDSLYVLLHWVLLQEISFWSWRSRERGGKTTLVDFFLNLSVAIKGKLSNHRALMYWVEVRRLPATWGLLSMALMLPQHYLYNSSLCLF